MLSCKESAELMSQDLDRALGLHERFGLQLHLLFCYGCRNVRQQLKFIRHACEFWLRRDD